MTLGQDTVPERIAHAREPSKLPVVLSADEVVRFLEAIPSLKSRTALTTVYAAGLRVSEVVLLKIADIDSQRIDITAAVASHFIEPCLPSPGEQPPTGPDWVHEIKHDGYRLMARRDPVSVGIRLLTRNAGMTGRPATRSLFGP